MTAETGKVLEFPGDGARRRTADRPDLLWREVAGQVLRAERLKRGLLQREVAALLEVEVAAIVSWELGRKEPKVSYLPRILSFLGYNPFGTGTTPGERLRNARRSQGLTQAKLARKLGIATCTLQRLEEGRTVTNERVLDAALTERVLSVMTTCVGLGVATDATSDTM